MGNVQKSAKRYSMPAIHTCVINVKLHYNLNYMANCFSQCLNGKKLQNGVKSEYFPKSPLSKYIVKFTSLLKYWQTGHFQRGWLLSGHAYDKIIIKGTYAETEFCENYFLLKQEVLRLIRILCKQCYLNYSFGKEIYPKVLHNHAR